MKYFFYIALIAFTFSCKNTDVPADNKETSTDVTTLYLIRHAEKEITGDPDPHLTKKGAHRAEQWTGYFFLKDLDHVLSSDYNRTRATAVPLAKSKKKEVEIYDVKSLTGKELYDKYQGKTVALFGHSNTIGNYANDLQVDKKFEDLKDDDYDHFYIVRIDKSGNANAVKETMDFIE
jgi:broad specificity phosphatase PhoE